MPLSRNPDAARRQLANLGRSNPSLLDRLEAGELPGFKGPLPGTEHLDPEAAAAVTPPAAGPPAEPPPAAPAAPQPPAATVLPYSQEPTDAPAAPPDDSGPGPGADDDDDADLEPARRRRGPLGELADGFLGRV